MKKIWIYALIGALFLSGCSQPSGGSSMESAEETSIISADSKITSDSAAESANEAPNPLEDKTDGSIQSPEKQSVNESKEIVVHNEMEALDLVKEHLGLEGFTKIEDGYEGMFIGIDQYLYYNFDKEEKLVWAANLENTSDNGQLERIYIILYAQDTGRFELGQKPFTGKYGSYQVSEITGAIVQMVIWKDCR